MADNFWDSPAAGPENTGFIDTNPINWGMAAFQGIAEKATGELGNAQKEASRQFAKAQEKMQKELEKTQRQLQKEKKRSRTLRELRDSAAAAIAEKKDSVSDALMRYVLPAGAALLGVAVATTILTRRNP